ncbi:MAG: hypothetical protein Q7J25_10115, partial [Vicinamibacterales bacterium]|nr:hypothetical protein [Vicinamibacterales bacterium]
MRVMHTTVWVSAAILLGTAGPARAASRTVADAARGADAAAVRALLQQRADPNVPQPDGTTAL